MLLTLDEIPANLDLSLLRETGIEHVIVTSALELLPSDAKIPDMLRDKTKRSIPDTTDMMDLVEANKGISVEDPGLHPEDVAHLTHTSGTTGPPKGAMNTHGSIAFNARVYEKMACIDDKDVVLGVAPLFHVSEEVAHLAIAAFKGIPLVLYYRFDPGETLSLIEKWKASFTVASNTVYIALLHHPDSAKIDLSTFVKAYSGGAPVSVGSDCESISRTHRTIHLQCLRHDRDQFPLAYRALERKRPR